MDYFKELEKLYKETLKVFKEQEKIYKFVSKKCKENNNNKTKIKINLYSIFE